jgi:hypothetical protein
MFLTTESTEVTEINPNVFNVFSVFSVSSVAKKGVVMKIPLIALILGLLLLAAGCTTTANSEKPKIHCPACGTDLDALMHKHF